MEGSVEARDALARLMAITPAQTIAVLNHLGVADLLVDGARSAADLAARCGVSADALHRLLRFAASNGVFTEVERATFALNDLAYWLRSDVEGSMWWRADSDSLVKPWLPWEEWLETVRTGEPAYDRMHGRSFWEALDADEDARAVFDMSLRTIAAGQIAALVPHLPLDGCRTVVDVGAGDGSWLMAIVGDGRATRGVAFDLPQAMPTLSETRANAGLDDRVDLVAGDFFVEVPAGDTLLLANVLHDWDDARASLILQRCREAIEPGGRLLIVDRVLPEGDTPHRGKSVDINMLFLLGGRERTRHELDVLLAASGFDLVEIGNETGGVAWLHARPTATPEVSVEAGARR
jgi:hypothetical protein